MSSQALLELAEALKEIEALQKANPSPTSNSAFRKPHITRAIGRAEVVLLSSHFERYIYGLNQQAVDVVVATQPIASSLTDEIRLRHSRVPVDNLIQMRWDNRASALKQYSIHEASIWIDHQRLTDLDHERLLVWMRAPTCSEINKFFRMWGVTDVFSQIAIKPTIRSHLWLRIEELVDKRNNIAHGDRTVEATYLDVRQYKTAVWTFCSRVDKLMARHLVRLLNTSRPW
jgi:hypothetical protein